MHNDGVVVSKVEFQCNLNLSLNPVCGDSAGRVDLFEGRWEKGSVIQYVERLQMIELKLVYVDV